jgi:hypothetical protein
VSVAIDLWEKKFGYFVEVWFADFVFSEGKVVLNFGEFLSAWRAGFSPNFFSKFYIYRTQNFMSQMCG